MPVALNEVSNDIVETTDEEREAFLIVRAIAARVVSVNRVTMRDAKSYCAVLVDDNNRKPVCRFYFNSPTTKHLGLFGADKVETRVRLKKPADIYQHIEAIEAALLAYPGP